MGGEHGCFLVVFLEAGVGLLFFFLFLSHFLKERSGLFHFLSKLFFSGYGGHGEGGGQFRVFRSLSLQQVIQGKAQFVLEIGEPLGFEELL